MERYSLSAQEERIGATIVDAAVAIHKVLGAGLLESIYEVCLHHELTKRGLVCRRQVSLPIVYDGIVFEQGLRLDLLIEELVICELKATDGVNPVYFAQLLSYLKLSKKHVGFLINFNVPLMKSGIRRVIA
ncbi:MAG: GxxExxY protein [Roseiflexaceae bacterium]|nr:GxxExxY protein [Roseiflexaceae bacterium]